MDEIGNGAYQKRRSYLVFATMGMVMGWDGAGVGAVGKNLGLSYARLINNLCLLMNGDGATGVLWIRSRLDLDRIWGGVWMKNILYFSLFLCSS